MGGSLERTPKAGSGPKGKDPMEPPVDGVGMAPSGSSLPDPSSSPGSEKALAVLGTLPFLSGEDAAFIAKLPTRESRESIPTEDQSSRCADPGNISLGFNRPCTPGFVDLSAENSCNATKLEWLTPRP